MRFNFFSSVKRFFRSIIPESLYTYLRITLINVLSLSKKKKILKFLLESGDPDQIKIAGFLADNPLSMFPYSFTYKYIHKDITVYKTNQMQKYVIYEDKKLFFKDSWSDRNIQYAYNSLLREQDFDSPHCYHSCAPCVPEYGEIIADVGAAEGIWALSVIEKCSKAYFFESDRDWLVALERTFAPWNEKVVFVNKLVGKENSKDSIALDSYFCDKAIDCIKADIEGSEPDLIFGAKKTLTEKVRKSIICCYHNYGDEAKIKSQLTKCNFDDFYISGHMFLSFDGSFFNVLKYVSNLSPPYLSRGIVFASKRLK